MLASSFITGAHPNLGATDLGKTYELPGSNHAIVAGETSNDLTQQHLYVHTVINASKSVDVPHIMTNTEPQATSQDCPHCFVADTDSVGFVLDTGANHTIINDARHVYGYKLTRAKVKGIGGDPTLSSGRGLIGIPLKSEGGRTSLIKGVPVMHIPSCPYNLLPVIRTARLCITRECDNMLCSLPAFALQGSVRICCILCYLTFTFIRAQYMRRRAILTSMHDRGYGRDSRPCARDCAHRQMNMTIHNARLYVEIYIYIT